MTTPSHTLMGSISPRESLSPYVEGVHHVQRLLLLGGWAAVERAWLGELQSTSQLFRATGRRHTSRESKTIAWPQWASQCRAKSVDVMGELSLRAVIGRRAMPDEVETSLASLVSDIAAVFQCPGFCVAAWHFQFDDESATSTVAGWLRASLALPQQESTEAQQCAHHVGGAATLVGSGYDIAITSVYPCGDSHADAPANPCGLASGIAGQLSGFFP